MPQRPTNLSKFMLRPLAVLLGCLAVCGCGRPLLSNYSSLKPHNSGGRTFRFQDSQLPDQTNAPKARLLAPDFGETENGPAAAATFVAPAAAASQNRNFSQPEYGSSGGHSLQMQTPSSNARIQTLPASLARAESTGPWPAKTDASSAATASALTAEPQVGDFDTPPTTQVPVQQISSPLEVPAAQSPSMMDRLKNVFDAQESSARELWKKNLQRIQSPFNRFLDRTEEPPPTVVPAPPTEPAVQPVAPEVATAVLPPPMEAAPVQTPAAPSGGRDEILRRLIEQTEQQLQTWPRDPQGQLVNPAAYLQHERDRRMLYLIANDQGKALSTIPAKTAADQEFWQALMLAMTHYRTLSTGTLEERADATIAPLQVALDRLRASAPLKIRRFEFCERIHSFGRVEGLLDAEFDAGQPILLYAEIENATTEVTGFGEHRTSFDAAIHILHDDSDEPIESFELTDISDTATSRRTDYYQSFELTIPSHLAAGNYRVHVRLTDNNSGRTTERELSFQVR